MNEVMKAFGTLAGVVTYVAMKEGVDPEAVLDKINEAIGEWVALIDESRQV